MKLSLVKFVAPAALLGALLAPIAANAAPWHNPNQRLHEQHHRIVQGIRSGQLTPTEARRLEHRDAVIRTQDRRFHRTGGYVSPAERARLERELNHSSHSIYRQKHDNQHRGWYHNNGLHRGW